MKNKFEATQTERRFGLVRSCLANAGGMFDLLANFKVAKSRCFVSQRGYKTASPTQVGFV